MFLRNKIAKNVFDDLPHAWFQDLVIFIFKMHTCAFFNRQRRLNTRHVFSSCWFNPFCLIILGVFFRKTIFLDPWHEKLSTSNLSNNALDIIPVLPCHNVTEDAYCTKVKSVDGTDEPTIARHAAWAKSDKKVFAFT